MVPVVIFYAHVVFLAYIFTKNYIEQGFVSAFLSSVFVVIIFSVGWTLSEFIMAFFMEAQGFSLLFPRAAFSLLLLSILEVTFYTFYFKRTA